MKVLPAKSLDAMSEQLLTPQQLADRHQLPLSTIYVWRTRGKGPRGLRSGKHVRYRLSDVIEWEESQADPIDAA